MPHIKMSSCQRLRRRPQALREQQQKRFENTATRNCAAVTRLLGSHGCVQHPCVAAAQQMATQNRHVQRRKRKSGRWFIAPLNQPGRAAGT